MGFGGTETITINAATCNVADAERVAPSIVRVHAQPGWFGAITGVMVNGTPAHIRCATGCILAGLPADSAVNVTLRNAWGATTHTVVRPRPGTFSEEPVIAGSVGQIDWRVFVVLAVIIGSRYAVLRVFRAANGQKNG